MLDPSGFTPPYDHHLCQGIQSQQWDVNLLTSPDWHTEERDINYEVTEFFYNLSHQISIGGDRFHKFSKGFEHMIDMGRVVQYLRKMSPRVVHFQWLPLPIIDVSYIKLINKISPTVLTIHDTNPYHGESPSLIQRAGIESVPKIFDHLIVHTNHSKSQLVKRGHSPDKISVIPHGVFHYGVDEPHYESGEGTGNDNIDLLMFGTIKRYKGVETAIRAISKMDENIQSKIQLTIAGRPKADIQAYQKMASELNVEDNIEWITRFIEKEEVDQLFKTCDIVALPYKNADQSGVLMSALPYGKPVVASNIGGFQEILDDGTHGYLFPPGNSDELSKALSKLAVNPDLRNLMGENVRELSKSQKYSWEKIASETLDVYKSLT